MINLIALATVLSAIAPTEALPQARPTPAPNGTIIVKILPMLNVLDPNYILESPTKSQSKDVERLQKQENITTPDTRLEEMKKILNERFKKMFELKKYLDKQQSEMSSKWEEYYSMNQAYNHELKKIIADWVIDNNYNK